MHRVFKKYEHKLNRDLIDCYEKTMVKTGNSIICIIFGFNEKKEIYKLYLYDTDADFHYGKEVGKQTERLYVNTTFDRETIESFNSDILNVYPKLADMRGHIRYENNKKIALYVNTLSLNTTVGKEAFRIKKILTLLNCDSSKVDEWIDNNKHETLTYFGIHSNNSFTVYHSNHSYFTIM